MHWSRGGVWKEDILTADVEELDILEASEIYPRRLNTKGVLRTQRKGEIVFPDSRWYSKIVRKGYKFQEPTVEREQTERREREFQWRFLWRSGRVSTDRINRWRWSPQRFLVFSRWLHLSSSYWTKSSTLCAERRNISYSTEIQWCYEVNKYRSGRCTRKTYWWLLECWWRWKIVRFMDRIHEVSFVERDVSKTIHVVREETAKNSNNYSTRSCVALKRSQDCESRSTKRKNKNG